MTTLFKEQETYMIQLGGTKHILTEETKIFVCTQGFDNSKDFDEQEVDTFTYGELERYWLIAANVICYPVSIPELLDTRYHDASESNEYYIPSITEYRGE